MSGIFKSVLKFSGSGMIPNPNNLKDMMAKNKIIKNRNINC